MNALSGVPARARHLALLLGALLHLAGAVALPVLHVWTAPLPSPGGAVALATLAAADGDERGAPAHDEVHCVLCHVQGEAAAPADGPQVPLLTAGRAAAPAFAPVVPVRHPAADTRARAPPLS